MLPINYLYGKMAVKRRAPVMRPSVQSRITLNAVEARVFVTRYPENSYPAEAQMIIDQTRDLQGRARIVLVKNAWPAQHWIIMVSYTDATNWEHFEGFLR